jgi:large subunit ribosomal protein L18
MKKDIQKHRILVYRSNRYIYGQIIDDSSGKTLFTVTDKGLSEKNKIKRAYIAGENLAKKSLKLKIKHVWFDRNGYRYHGRVQSFAEGARKGGMDF